MSERIAVVTGAGSGIGRAITRTLGGAGWTVVATGRREGPLTETVAAVDGRAVAVPSDVTRSESVDALFDEVRTRFDRLDLLVNNAGAAGPPVPFEDLSPAQWRACLDVNLTGAFLCAQGAFRQMRDQQPRGGRIINSGSISAYSPRPHSAPYTAAKHAVSGLTKAMSLDGRPHRIACGQIDVGNAATDMTTTMNHGVPQADGSLRPEPTIDAQHVADAVLQMASLPLDANIQTLTVLATFMPFVGRG